MIENRQVIDRAWPAPNSSAVIEARRELEEKRDRQFDLVQSILTGTNARFFNIDAANPFDYEQHIPVMLAVGKFLHDGKKEALLRVIEDEAWTIANKEIK